MIYNKKSKKSHHKYSLFAGLISLIIGITIGLGSTQVFAQLMPAGKKCEMGTWVSLYSKCLATQQNGVCPTGTTKLNNILGPNNCEARLIDVGSTSTNTGPPTYNVGAAGRGKYQCGKGEGAVKISINIGCLGASGNIENALIDASFAILRFLSIGVGLVIIGSIVYGGIQYSASRGDPNGTSEAIKRIRNSVYALFIYIFAAAILNFLIPQGFFNL